MSPMRRGIVVAGVVVGWVGCGGGGKKKAPMDAPPPCVMNLAGALTADRTIAGGCTVTVTDDVTVMSGTLTLEAGATVLFLEGRSLVVAPEAAAKLVVAGTIDQPVRMSAAPDVAAWGQLRVGPGATGSTITGLSVEKAGKDGKSAVLIEAADVAMTRSTVKDVGAVGIELAADKSFGTFEDNRIERTGKELVRIGPEAAGSIGEHNTFGGGGVIAVVPGTLSRSVTWRARGAPYLVADMLQVQMKDTRATLTLDEGVEVRFTVKAGLGIGVNHPGGLKVSGTAARPVTLVSADGQAGAWNVWIGRHGEAVIDHAIVKGGGTDREAGAVAVRGGSLELYNTKLSDVVVGVSVDEKGKLAVDGCTFERTGLFAVSLATQLASLRKNTFDSGAKVELRGGTIDESVTWKPETKVWWSGRVAVTKGALTIEAGSDFQMMDKASLDVIAAAPGKKKPAKADVASLVIKGTADAPVKMIGVRSTPGTWDNIGLTGVQDSTIEHLQLASSGGDAAITVGDGVHLSLAHVRCEQCAGAIVTSTCGGTVSAESIEVAGGTPAATVAPTCPAAATK
ncbi:MAG TPA: hypothetical protein VM261_26535 [Kofleriaceae bacterium]|nr:hypothetical protein [Kofleriaceae bacterium]